MAFGFSLYFSLLQCGFLFFFFTVVVSLHEWQAAWWGKLYRRLPRLVVTCVVAVIECGWEHLKTYIYIYRELRKTRGCGCDGGKSTFFFLSRVRRKQKTMHCSFFFLIRYCVSTFFSHRRYFLANCVVTFHFCFVFHFFFFFQSTSRLFAFARTASFFSFNGFHVQSSLHQE